MKAIELGTRRTQVFYLHGLRGHALSQRTALEHVVRGLGVTLVALELPGHGADSKVERCMVPRFERLVDDIVSEIKIWSRDADHVFLMGYSFGAALMSLAAVKLEQDPEFSPQVAGYIGISSAFDVAHNVPRWQLGLAGLIAPLSRLFYRHAPNLSRWLTIGEMNIDLISADPAVRQTIKDDVNTYKGRIPLNTSAQVYRASIAAKQALSTLRCGVLLVHSKDDAIAKCPTSETFTKNVQLKIFDGLRHNCIDGVLREAVLARRAMTEFLVANRSSTDQSPEVR